MTLTKKLNPVAMTALVVSCLTFIWQEESKAATFVVDSFNDNPANQGLFFVSPNNVPPFTQGPNTKTTGLSGIAVGDSRTLGIELTQNNLSNFLPSNVSVSGGVLQISNAPGANSISTVTLDANGAGLGGIDITDGGKNDRFLFNIVNIDLSANFQITLRDTSAVAATFTLSGINTTGDKAIFFSQLDTFGTINLNSIDSITYVISGQNDFDFAIDQLVTRGTEMPEPSTVFSILGIGVLGRIVSKKKKSD